MAARKRHAQSKQSITSQRGKKRHILHPKIPTPHNSMPEKGMFLLPSASPCPSGSGSGQFWISCKQLLFYNPVSQPVSLSVCLSVSQYVFIYVSLWVSEIMNDIMNGPASEWVKVDYQINNKQEQPRVAHVFHSSNELISECFYMIFFKWSKGNMCNTNGTSYEYWSDFVFHYQSLWEFVVFGTA